MRQSHHCILPTEGVGDLVQGTSAFFCGRYYIAAAFGDSPAMSFSFSYQLAVYCAPNLFPQRGRSAPAFQANFCSASHTVSSSVCKSSQCATFLVSVPLAQPEHERTKQMHYPINFRGLLGEGEVMMYAPGDTRQVSRVSYALCVCWLSMVQAVSSALSICFPCCKGSGHTRLIPLLRGNWTHLSS